MAAWIWEYLSLHTMHYRQQCSVIHFLKLNNVTLYNAVQWSADLCHVSLYTYRWIAVSLMAEKPLQWQLAVNFHWTHNMTHRRLQLYSKYNISFGLCKSLEQTTLCPPKTCDYILYNNFNNKCPITIIYGIVSNQSMRHRKMVSFPTSPI